ncbi:MAG: fibronectin [Verrucomicrobiales bacterium]|nr:fibronectin [Verrucomicrobiales bacterium]
MNLNQRRIPRGSAAFAACLLWQAAPVGIVRADYLDDVGYRSLLLDLGAAMPTGAGVGVSQIEFGNPEYLPEAGTGTFPGTGIFAGKTFTEKSGATAVSGHAAAVGLHFFSLNTDPGLGRATMTPGISAIDVYRVDSTVSPTSWTDDIFLKPGTAREPLIESRAVQNHSWISEAENSESVTDNDLLRRLDFAVRRDGFLPVTGVNNGSSAVPSLMASAYNNLAVGLSSGGHSTGGVVAWLDGAGRQKPELVTPLDYTSFSTGLVSSGAALLRQAGSALGASAVRPETIKAILLAGATKGEFPGWTRSETMPLDPVFGAGEMNISHSWHIMNGGGQTADAVTVRPAKAWGYATLATGGTADYLLSVAPGTVGTELSAVASWNRVITDSSPGTGFTMAVSTLANYQLSLARVPVSGAAVVVDQSLSPIENLEHVYQKNLPSGTWRLRLSLAAGTSAPAALAWRLESAPHRPGIAISRSGTVDSLTFSGLLAGQAYVIQSSETLASWTNETTFTANPATFVWTTTASMARRFYRLAATN